MSEKIRFPGNITMGVSFGQEPLPSEVVEQLDRLQEFAAVVEDYRVKHNIPRRGLALFLATCLQLQITQDLSDAPEGDDGEDEEEPLSKQKADS